MLDGMIKNAATALRHLFGEGLCFYGLNTVGFDVYLHNNNISDRSDYERLKTVQKETDKKIAALKKFLRTARECTRILLILIILLLRVIMSLNLWRENEKDSLLKSRKQYNPIILNYPAIGNFNNASALRCNFFVVCNYYNSFTVVI